MTYFECPVCCYGVSGPDYSPSLDDRIDAHFAETGHTMKEVYDDE